MSDAVWCKCRDCDRWTVLTDPNVTILYSFSEAPIINWFYYKCATCDDDKPVFLLKYADPEYLLAVLQDSSGVTEIALEHPSDYDLALFGTCYGHIPRMHLYLSIETAVAEFARLLEPIDSPLEAFE